ncbi:MAG: hypothetical protein QOI74_125 [Micromonosporaceae bacterium]|jgi:hypothetical protein|nr:hypothetical protein [Micromonosporaceae bacterium]
MARPTTVPAGPARASGVARTRALSTVTRLSDCLLLGVCCAVAAVGVVTAGPGLAAAATVVRGWAADEQPPLVATFVTAIRRHTVGLLGPQLALLGMLLVGWLDLAAAGGGLPGGGAVRVFVGLTLAVAVASYLAMFGIWAAHGGSWWSAWARSATLCVRRPWLPVALTAVLAIGALLVSVAPPTVVVIGGPLALAVGVLVSRADGGRVDDGRVDGDRVDGGRVDASVAGGDPDHGRAGWRR